MGQSMRGAYPSLWKRPSSIAIALKWSLSCQEWDFVVFNDSMKCNAQPADQWLQLQRKYSMASVQTHATAALKLHQHAREHSGIIRAIVTPYKALLHNIIQTQCNRKMRLKIANLYAICISTWKGWIFRIFAEASAGLFCMKKSRLLITEDFMREDKNSWFWLGGKIWELCAQDLEGSEWTCICYDWTWPIVKLPEIKITNIKQHLWELSQDGVTHPITTIIKSRMFHPFRK